MKIPNFVGMKLEEIIKILNKDYPDLKPRIVMYTPPGLKDKEIDGSEARRIIRQRLLKERELELVVSVFREQPD